MRKKLNLFLCSLGLAFIGLIVWDCYKSTSHLPEGLWYIFRRVPDSYPVEIQTNINQIQVTADKKLEARTVEITEKVRKQIEDSNTGCISFRGLSNAVCFGAKETTSSQTSNQSQ